MLLLVVEWIKHAEAKAAATLASAGVLAGLLYTLVERTKKPGPAFVVAAAICAGAVLTTAAAAGAALRPRVRVSGPNTGLLYYRNIALGYPDGPDRFAEEFARLAGDQSTLLQEVARQVWANSIVATRKYRALNLAIATLFATLAALASAATFARLHL